MLESDGTLWTGPIGLTRIAATARAGSADCRGGTEGTDVARPISIRVPNAPGARIEITVATWTPEETRLGTGVVTMPADADAPCAASIRLAVRDESAAVAGR